MGTSERPIFGDPKFIELAKVGKEKAKHENCKYCHGVLERPVVCEECDGTGEILIECNHED